jgi:hypothetical protein
MAKVIGKAPAPRGNKSRKKQKLRDKAFREIAKEYPHLVETEEKKKELMDILNETSFATNSNGELKMFYKGEEIKE